MADVTISGLNPGIPSGTDVIPFSNSTTTSKVQIQSLPVAWGSVSGKPSFATVATTGNYNDLTNKPSIPASYLPYNGIAVFYNTIGYSTGNFSWTVPSGITKIKVTAVGAGGGGSNSQGAGGSTTFTINGITITGGGGNSGGSGAHGNGGTASGGDVNIGGFTRGPGGGYPNHQYGSFYALGGAGNGFFGFGAGGSPYGGGWAGGCGGIAIKIFSVSAGQTATIVTGAEGGGGGWQAGARGAVLVEW